MRKLVVATFVTLDGVLQAPGAPNEDPSGGFEHGGWLVPFADEEFGRRMVEHTEGGGALLLGRLTYEILGSHWPLIGDEDPIARKLNAMPKSSSRGRSSAGTGTTPRAARRRRPGRRALKRQDGGEIHVIGSGELIQTLLRHDLIDVFRLSTFPVVLGSGKRLFGRAPRRPACGCSTARRRPPASRSPPTSAPAPSRPAASGSTDPFLDGSS